VSEPELKKILLRFDPARALYDAAEIRSSDARSDPGASG
jgi:hypothetical protein